MAGSGIIVAVLAFALPLFGVPVDQNAVAAFVDNVAKVIGFVLMVWGQARRPDLRFGLIRKA